MWDGAWKVRGDGEVRLLKPRDSGLIRIIMRQDKTLKLRMNHKVSNDATLAPQAGTDKAWVFAADDFAEEKVEKHKFAIKFRDAGA